MYNEKISSEEEEDSINPVDKEVLFEQMFKIPYSSLINTLYMEGNSYDDGLHHFIHPNTLDVYSYDDDSERWVEKNTYQQQVLKNVKYEKYLSNVLYTPEELLQKNIGIFEQKFNIPFSSVVDTRKMNRVFFENEKEIHFIHPKTLDVYTFDINLHEWKYKNQFKYILKRVRYQEYFEANNL